MPPLRIALGIAGISIIGLGLAAVPFLVAPRAPSAAAVVEAPAAAPQLAGQAPETDRARIEGIVRDYMLANPELLRDMMTALQMKDQAEQRERSAQALKEMGDELFNSPNQIVLGNPDGDVTLVEFFDYNCGYCRQVYEHINALIAADPKLRVVFKEYPVLRDESVQSARVAVAVHRLAPERYMDFHNALMRAEGIVDGDAALAIAEGMGLSGDALMTDVNDPANEAYIRESHEIAQQLGVDGTPYFIVGGEVIPGATSRANLQKLIANTRACGAAAC